MDDAWLAAMDETKESGDKVARRLEAARRAEQRRLQAEAEDEEKARTHDAMELRATCVRHMQAGETILRALRRLGGGGTGDDGRRKAFDELTEAASALLSGGDMQVYSKSREELAGSPQEGDAQAQGGGYVWVEDRQLYYNEQAGYWYDPTTGLYWDPRQQPPVYYWWDAARNEYSVWEQPAAAPAAAVAAPGAAQAAAVGNGKRKRPG